MAGVAVLSSDHKLLLDSAVAKMIREWHVIQVAVDNDFGGPQTKEKAQWLEEVTSQYLTDNGRCHIGPQSHTVVT